MRAMFTLLSCLFALSAIAGEPTPEQACDAIAERTANTVTPSIPELVVDEATQTTEDLALMSGFHNDNRSTVGGITASAPLVRHEIISNLVLLPDGKGVCARPAIHLTIGYQHLSVFMDWEIPRNSCIYNAIFAHEMHHVAIYKDYLKNHLDAFRQNTDAKFNGKPYFFKSLYEAKQYIEILGDVFTQHLKAQFMAEVSAEQYALDTEAEYSRMQMECAGGGHAF